jgi:hypothetical protein
MIKVIYSHPGDALLDKSEAIRNRKREPKPPTAKSLIRAQIIRGRTDAAILTAVHKKLPWSRANKKHVTKYRRDLYLEGTIDARLAAHGSHEHQRWGFENQIEAKRSGPHKARWRTYQPIR